ncbi:hypothetical protein ACR71G_16450 [Xenorhabdus bovienii]|uniref:hypothetical protein n=1 Tax=Xenorhabdus bovienii TaxID=40576 RepID=UPI003DA4C4FE
MPLASRETIEEEMRSIQQSHSADEDIDSATSEIGRDSSAIFSNESVRLDQIKDPRFWKENIAGYYNWMVVVKEELKKLDLTLNAMESLKSTTINTAKNMGIAALQTGINTGTSAAGAAVGGAVGGAIGTAVFPVIGTSVGAAVGSGVGLLAGLGLNILIGIAVDKLKYKLEIAHPYPKTRKMILAINNYNRNSVMKVCKNIFNRNDLKDIGGKVLTGIVTSGAGPIKLPVHGLIDLAISHDRAS